MTDERYFYYKICREHAGFTQEEASVLIHSGVRQLSKYENEGGVPEEVVKLMVTAYKTPLLGWWHLKNFSPLGEYLPDVVVAKTNGDFMFQLILADDEITSVYDSNKHILSDGRIESEEQQAFIYNRDKLEAISGKIMSAKMYADELINGF